MKNNVLVSVRKIYHFKALETKKGVINKLNVSMRQIENYYPCEKKENLLSCCQSNSSKNVQQGQEASQIWNSQ